MSNTNLLRAATAVAFVLVCLCLWLAVWVSHWQESAPSPRGEKTNVVSSHVAVIIQEWSPTMTLALTNALAMGWSVKVSVGPGGNIEMEMSR